MPLLDLLDETKRWAEEDLFPRFEDMPPWREAYPPVDLAGACRDDLEEATSDSTSREVIETLRGYLAATPHEVAVRWTILGCLYVLGNPNHDDDDYDASWESGDQEEFREELKVVVRVAEVDRLTDARVTRWEIMNSCMVSDFDRAERLFERLEEIDPVHQAQHWAVRGQFHFWLSLTRPRERDPFLWMPSLFPASSNYALRLARLAIGLEPTTVDPDAGGPHLRKAADLFQKALDAGCELPLSYRAVLARCLLLDSQYARAAENYQVVLSRGLVLQGKNAKHNDELEACLYVATADSWNRAHDTAAAKTLLRACVEMHPGHADAWRALAELYASETKYQEAYNTLDQWAEKQPELDSDIWVKTLRALGGVEKQRDWRHMLDEFFLNHPERLAAVRETVDSHWGAFKDLGEKSKKEWLYGCFRLWWATPGYESVHYPDVVTHFAVAVEIEVREVFRRFIEEAKKSTEILQSVEQGNGKRAERWQRWLRSVEFKGGLGEMLDELDPSRKSNLRSWQRLQVWLNSDYAIVKKRFGLLKTDQLVALRNPAVHRTRLESKEDALEACQLCQTFLTALLSKS